MGSSNVKPIRRPVLDTGQGYLCANATGIR